MLESRGGAAARSFGCQCARTRGHDDVAAASAAGLLLMASEAGARADARIAGVE